MTIGEFRFTVGSTVLASFGAKIFLPKASEAFSTENVKYHDNISQEVEGFYRILRDFIRYQVTIMYRDS
jgi:hypothetical protein